ncbi:MAG: hypothetical protein BGO55_16180 [Sphingobacteriales bacterium 50-39]|nr:MAG: hypothetical protein BGO55_16180 [Sphingobacteriales bacterium 50-39]
MKAIGVVYNEAGQPLSGANVTIKATGKGTITNAKGEFELPAVPEESPLVISFIGYAPQVIKVNEGKSIQVYLSVAKNELDKVVIQGYGITSHRLATGDIGVVRADEIEKNPVVNPLLALQGRVAGLDVNQTSGYASAPIKVELRGRSAIGDFPSDPLYIVDGVPLTVLEVAGNSGYNSGSVGYLQSGNGLLGPANGQSPFFNINPADIESIEVLKDADATAIYGSRGANGVILITTKKGKAGKTKFDIRAESGIKRYTRFWKLLNTPQYLEMRREAFKNDGIIPDAGNAPDLLVWDTTKYTDWQKRLYGRTGKYSDAELNLSGGDARTVFRIGAGYHREVGITVVSGADERGSASFTLNHKSLNQRLGINFTNQYSYSKSNMISIGGALDMPPNAPDIYDSAGNLNYNGWGVLRNTFPFASLKRSYIAKTNFLNSNLVLSYEVIKGLLLKSSFGYNNAQADQEFYIPIASYDPIAPNTGSSEFGYNTNRNWIVEPQVTYDRVIGKGKLSVLGGASVQSTTTKGIFIAGSGYTTDDLITAITNAPNKQATENYSEYRYAGVFGRINYNYEDKYIINLSARRDGSSKFGSGNQFGNFGAVGLAWIFSEESWIKDNITFLSFGKLRSSIGTTGSDLIGLYGYLTRFSSSSLQTYMGIQPLAPTQHANPNYRWQVNKQMEIAIELGFLKDRLTLTTAAYRNRCGNQLVNFPTPGFTGFSTVVANSPALVENSGLEFMFAAKLIDNKDFKWSINFNTSFNKNKLIAYPNLQLSPYAGTLVIGKSLNITKSLHYTGVDPQTGLYTFEDKDKDGQITVNYSGKSDDRYDYNLSPRFFGGLGSNISYKGFQISLFFNIKKQLGFNTSQQGQNPGDEKNQPVGVLNRWQQPGDMKSVAKFTTQGGLDSYRFFGLSDAGISDASYIRLSNLAASYTLPVEFVQKRGIQGASLFFQTNNLFVITKYKGIDPETQNFGGLPPPKTIVLGLSLNF